MDRARSYRTVVDIDHINHRHLPRGGPTGSLPTHSSDGITINSTNSTNRSSNSDTSSDIESNA